MVFEVLHLLVLHAASKRRRVDVKSELGSSNKILLERVHVLVFFFFLTDVVFKQYSLFRSSKLMKTNTSSLSSLVFD